MKPTAAQPLRGVPFGELTFSKQNLLQRAYSTRLSVAAFTGLFIL
jgi:hypothetical protein